MSMLKLLHLQNNSLLGCLSSIADVRLPNLEALLLWGNNFSGTIPRFIFNASKLSILELSQNSFSGFIPNTFGNLRNLEWLNLRDNYLTSSTPELSFLSSLSNCKSLTFIHLSDNPLDGILSKTSIGNLSHSLKDFYMSNCNVSGGIPEEITNLTNSITIDLGGNKLNGSIPITLSKLQKLQGLGLDDNKLEGSIPDSICRLTELYELELGGNKLFGSIPACFSNLASLRILSLSSNELTSIPLTFWNLKDILQLNFSSNFLTGPLPLEIGNLKVLIGIDFSMNNFSSVIPTEIGGLKNLEYLFLGYNRLEGSIPDSFGDLISLKFLNLSNNNLSGAIPTSLEKLSYLEDLNLSFNKLEGEIPRGGSFGNFAAESFEGNELLCGSPTLQVLPCKTSIHHTSWKNSLLLGIVLPLSTTLLIVVIWLILRYRKRGKQPSNDANMPLVATWRTFSYLELCRATNGFSENNLIGRGGFGSVYKARLGDGMEVAVKVFNLQCGRAFKSFAVECEMMKSIRHRNLIKVISSCSNEEFKALVLEYKPHGSLEKYLYSSNCILDIFQRLNIMIDVASALEYLHFGCLAPVIHCDLKPDNVLLDDNLVAYLSDFGIAKLLIGEDQSMTQTQTLATIGYMAPEYGREGRVSTNGDVYSFGIMLMETFTGKKPTDEIFNGEMTLKHWVNDWLPISTMEVVDANLLSQEDIHFVAKEQCVSFVFNLAMACTVESHEQRINAKEIRELFQQLPAVPAAFGKANRECVLKDLSGINVCVWGLFVRVISPALSSIAAAYQSFTTPNRRHQQTFAAASYKQASPPTAAHTQSHTNRHTIAIEATILFLLLLPAAMELQLVMMMVMLVSFNRDERDSELNKKVEAVDDQSGAPAEYDDDEEDEEEHDRELEEEDEEGDVYEYEEEDDFYEEVERNDEAVKVKEIEANEGIEEGEKESNEPFAQQPGLFIWDNVAGRHRRLLA
ncbi:protein kinase domain-containing protein [Citrus sinensis]|uniref:Protein kinase domain-containing protein n=1 Tax=Citrus sinensis TaxID=2711 RepID=A0ACB8JA17_CITSI|nr:protein kinase domain-containing protein [Citrus sinensis]